MLMQDQGLPSARLLADSKIRTQFSAESLFKASNAEHGVQTCAVSKTMAGKLMAILPARLLEAGAIRSL